MSIPALTDPEVTSYAARTALPLQLARILVLVARVVDEDMKLAIGGAVAACDAGRKRYTDDLDVFARPVSARKLVRGLREQGMETFWVTEAHGIAYIPEDNVEAIAAKEFPPIRVDVLSTITEPEASAIRTAISPRMLGLPLKVFRPDHLTAIKFLAGRPQDLVDFDELIRLGVDVKSVHYLVSTAEPSKGAAMMARARKALKPQGLRDKTGVYLTRDGVKEAWARTYEAHLAKSRGSEARAEKSA
jgi:hypothetical protein